MKTAIFKAVPLAAAMAFTATQAQAVDFTFCTVDGTPYCDGISVNTSKIGSNKSVYGTHTGCHDGVLYGSFAYGIYNLGPAAIAGFGTTSTYTGLYTVEAGFATPFPWRLVNTAGDNQNTGNLCFGLPSATATAAGDAAGN